MKIRGWLAWMSVAMMVGACGGDDESDGPPAQPASVNKELAAASAQSTISALSSISGADGASSASVLAGVAQSSQNLLQAQPGGATTQSVASKLSVEGAVGPLNMSGEGCTCTETSCTFKGCSPSAGSSSQFSFTIDGSYSWGGGRVQCKDLKYTFGGSNVGSPGASVGVSTKVAVTLNCDLTVTSTSIKGFTHSVGSSSTEVAGQNTQGAYSSTWDVKTTFKDVTFGDSRKPTGGSIDVEGTTTVTAAGQSQVFAGSAEVTFP